MIIFSRLLTRILRFDEPRLRSYVALVVFRSSGLTDRLNVRVFKIDREILLLDVRLRCSRRPAVFPLLRGFAAGHVFDVTDRRGLADPLQTVIPLVQFG